MTNNNILVRTDIEEKHLGLFFATSPDIKGLFVAKESFAGVVAAIPNAIVRLCAANGQNVIVVDVSDAGNGTLWAVLDVASVEKARPRPVRAQRATWMRKIAGWFLIFFPLVLIAVVVSLQTGALALVFAVVIVNVLLGLIVLGYYLIDDKPSRP